MAGVIAAPRNGNLTVGVAWGASLYSVRVDNDVALTNVDATRLGIRRASDVGARIISMAFGTTVTYSSIADEIAWHYYNRDRLFFAAAGTSLCNDSFHDVTFPGSLSTVTTVTALDQSGGIACNAHYGSAVDFAAYADQPTTGWGSSFTPAGIAGSSNATAILSGIAALIVADRQTSTRNDILVALTTAASLTGFRRNDIGWGVPDAYCAVRGMCLVFVDGVALIETSGSYTFAAQQSNSSGPFSYLWSSGETTQTVQGSITVSSSTQAYVFELVVTITDLSDGSQKTASKYVNVRQPNPDCPSCP